MVIVDRFWFLQRDWKGNDPKSPAAAAMSWGRGLRHASSRLCARLIRAQATYSMLTLDGHAFKTANPVCSPIQRHDQFQ
eukprot:6460645-Amphidinium_carterae.1